MSRFQPVSNIYLENMLTQLTHPQYGLVLTVT
jgi:hypothetical protein